MSKEDQALHKGLMKLLDEATFPLKAKEVGAFAAVYKWANDLPDKFTKKDKPVKKKKASK